MSELKLIWTSLPPFRLRNELMFVDISPNLMYSLNGLNMRTCSTLLLRKERMSLWKSLSCPSLILPCTFQLLLSYFPVLTSPWEITAAQLRKHLEWKSHLLKSFILSQWCTLVLWLIIFSLIWWLFRFTCYSFLSWIVYDLTFQIVYFLAEANSFWQAQHDNP